MTRFQVSAGFPGRKMNGWPWGGVFKNSPQNGHRQGLAQLAPDQDMHLGINFEFLPI